MMRTLLLSFSLLLSLAALSAKPRESQEPLNIGSRLELFVDRFLIDRLEGVRLLLHEPRPAGVALKVDRPWEGRLNYGYKVFKEGETYHLYYLARDMVGGEKLFIEYSSYARSQDGIHWEKPNLKLVERQGSLENNVVMKGFLVPFVDDRPGTPGSSRFKATMVESRKREDWKNEHPLDGKGYTDMYLFDSADAVKFRKVQEEPVFTTRLPNGFDGIQSIFWSETEDRYLLYFRYMTANDGTGKRSVARSTSRDLMSWTDPVPMEYSTGGIVPPEHLYEHQTVPYFRAPHIYVAFPPRFMKEQRVLELDTATKLGFVPDPTIPWGPNWRINDSSDAAFMTSRGGTLYDRTFMGAFVRPGPGAKNWTTRTNYPLQGVVPTGPDEMSIYVVRHYADPSWHIQRMTLRLDGFASLNAPYEGGQLITKPLKFEGSQLEINYSTSAAGGLKVEIQDEKGQPLESFSLKDCPEITGDEISRIVSWQGGDDVGSLAGRTVRLRFVMKDADLYSLRFR